MSKYLIEKTNTEERRNNSIENILLFSILIYTNYTMWFQYCVFRNGIFLTIVGIVMILGIFLTINIRSIHIYTSMTWILLFIFFFGYTGLLNTPSINGYIYTLFNMLEYCVPMIAIYVYVNANESKYQRIMKIIYVAAIIASVMSFTNGEELNNGAISLKGLNSNELSSNYTIGLMAGMYISAQKKGHKGIIVGLPLVLIMYAQINAASRRGLIVSLILFVIYAKIIVVNKYKERQFLHFAAVGLCIAIAIYLVTHLEEMSSNILVLRRLFDTDANQGDIFRKRYQNYALQLFESNPLIGKGFNALTLSGSVYSHSMYYELLACTGLLGFIILNGFFIYFLVKFMIDSNNSKLSLERKISSRLEFWYVIAIMITGIAVVLIYDSYFYIIIGLFSSYLSIIEKEDIRMQKSSGALYCKLDGI